MQKHSQLPQWLIQKQDRKDAYFPEGSATFLKGWIQIQDPCSPTLQGHMTHDSLGA